MNIFICLNLRCHLLLTDQQHYGTIKNKETEFPVVSNVTLGLIMSANSAVDDECILIYLNESVIEFSFLLPRHSNLKLKY